MQFTWVRILVSLEGFIKVAVPYVEMDFMP